MKHLFLLLVIACFISSIQAQTFNSIKPKTREYIDSLYEKLMKQHGVVGFSLAIVDSGKIVYSKGYGLSDMAQKIKADDNTIYRIGSISKSFTALSILQLQEQGKLSIENPLKIYLPEFDILKIENDKNSYPLNDIMTHISGLPCDLLNGFFCTNPPDEKWVATQLHHCYPISKSHFKHAYSNIGYGMLGQVISNVSNEKYSSYLKHKIFEPLQMNSSFVDLDTSIANRFSKGYISKKLTYEPLIRDAAAGLVHSSVIDMAKYVLMFLGKGCYKNACLLTQNSIANMQANHVSEALLNKNENWGYGLYSKNYYNKKDNNSVLLVGHGGDTYLYHADMGFINEYNVGAVILTNSEEGVKLNSAGNLLEKYLKVEKGIEIKSQAKDSSMVQTNEVQLNENEILGTYFLTNILLQVKDINKFKAKQGPATLVFKKKKNTENRYLPKAYIFGFIPFKIKNQEFAFAKINGKIYIKMIQTKKKTFSYMAVKTELKSVSDKWKNNVGNYHITENKFTCDKCPYGNFENLRMSLKVKNNVLYFALKFKDRSNNTETILLPLNDSAALTPGIGRGTGETVSILDNGNIFYSGFEFVKDAK